MLNLPPRTAVGEYSNIIAHGNDIGGVEIGEVKARQATATHKHCIQVSYVGGVETGDIQACQVLTRLEESTHVGHSRSVEVGKVETGKIATTRKHAESNNAIFP